MPINQYNLQCFINFLPILKTNFKQILLLMTGYSPGKKNHQRLLNIMIPPLAQEVPEQQITAKSSITESTTLRFLCFHVPETIPILATFRERLLCCMDAWSFTIELSLYLDLDFM